MEIAIDEAGSFVNKGAKAGSWCVVAAFVIPETEKRKIREALRVLKVSNGVKHNQEIKLGTAEEQSYFEFISKLGNSNCTLFSVATDSYLNDDAIVSKHRDIQADNITTAIPSMKHQGGKDALAFLSEQLSAISPQLYSQLVCQIQLMQIVTERAINYYVQRQPKALRCFKWRIDQKQPTHKTHFEDAFEKYTPGLLQSFSLEKPWAMLDWCNYSSMANFIYNVGEMPDYLVERFPHLAFKMGLNIQKIIRDDIKFVDSKDDVNVQIADLLASGLRRLLRSEFIDNELAAVLLGRLFVQAPKKSLPIKLVSFGDIELVHNDTANLIKIIIGNCKPMLAKI